MDRSTISTAALRTAIEGPWTGVISRLRAAVRRLQRGIQREDLRGFWNGGQSLEGSENERGLGLLPILISNFLVGFFFPAWFMAQMKTLRAKHPVMRPEPTPSSNKDCSEPARPCPGLTLR